MTAYGRPAELYGGPLDGLVLTVGVRLDGSPVPVIELDRPRAGHSLTWVTTEETPLDEPIEVERHVYRLRPGPPEYAGGAFGWSNPDGCTIYDYERKS